MYYATLGEAKDGGHELRTQIESARELIASLVDMDTARTIRAASAEIEIWYVPAHTGFCGIESRDEYMVRAAGSRTVSVPDTPGAHRCPMEYDI